MNVAAASLLISPNAIYLVFLYIPIIFIFHFFVISLHAFNSQMDNWTPDSYKTKELHKQRVIYPESAENSLNETLEKLADLPPLVSHHEIDRLKNQLAEVATNKKFLLQVFY